MAKFTTEPPYENVEITVSPKRAIPPYANRWAGLENSTGSKIKFVNGVYETEDADEITLLESKPYVAKSGGDSGSS